MKKAKVFYNDFVLYVVIAAPIVIVADEICNHIQDRRAVKQSMQNLKRQVEVMKKQTEKEFD